jgi:uncharacterized membrane protein YfcA
MSADAAGGHLLVLGAGFLAGAMNGIAGGGSFVTLPALIAAGVPPVSANASSTVALYPGGAASVWVYRHGLGPVCGLPLRPLLIATLVGGLLGALLLLWTPTAVFDRVLPWLLLVATLALAFGRQAGIILRARYRAGPAAVIGLQFVIGIYGGYFGGAVGLMMMAVWGLLDGADLKVLNAPRTVMVTAANTAAVVCFVIAGAVAWSLTLAMAAGALLGGYAGAWLGTRLPLVVVRIAVLAVAVGMTAVFFWRAYG